MRIVLRVVAALVLTWVIATPSRAQDRASSLRVVVHANLQILDPVWTTALITGRHAYLIYDTLYAMNSALEPQPQMAEGHGILEDGLFYRIRLGVVARPS